MVPSAACIESHDPRFDGMVPFNAKLELLAESGAAGVSQPRQCIRVFQLGEDGRSLRGGVEFHRISPGWVDGFRVDGAGYLCFGDRFGSRLFLCASTALYALFTSTRALPAL